MSHTISLVYTFKLWLWLGRAGKDGVIFFRCPNAQETPYDDDDDDDDGHGLIYSCCYTGNDIFLFYYFLTSPIGNLRSR